MARVVQRQSTPQYLLIVFVGLFVAALIGMVFFWIRFSQTHNDLATVRGNAQKVISSAELSRPDPLLKDMMNKYDRPVKGQAAQTVYAQLTQQIADLAALIGGPGVQVDAALQEAADVTSALGNSPGAGLVPQIKELYQRQQQASQLAQSRGKMLEEAQQALAQRDQALGELKKAVAQQIEQLNEQKLALEQMLQQRHQELVGMQNQAAGELGQVRSDLNTTISAKTSQIESLDRRLKETDQMAANLRAQLDQRRGPVGQGTVEATPDGRILEVIDREGICYVNIGSSSKAVPGLTFSVYPSTGIPEDGKGKAELMVTTVKDDISECRIVQQQPGNPIIQGDLVANIAFNPQRTHNFVIGGEFDLRDAGSPSANDLEEVRMMIRRSGGNLQENVGIDTDFVVLGAEPVLPARPLESAPATVWAAYNAQVRRYERYRQIADQARQMHVPILNTNRFLAFMGYPRTTQLGAVTR